MSLKRWRPGTVEVESYLVTYLKDGEKLGMYVQAEHERDARQQVRNRDKDIKILGVGKKLPTYKDEQLMDNYEEESAE